MVKYVKWMILGVAPPILGDLRIDNQYNIAYLAIRTITVDTLVTSEQQRMYRYSSLSSLEAPLAAHLTCPQT